MLKSFWIVLLYGFAIISLSLPTRHVVFCTGKPFPHRNLENIHDLKGAVKNIQSYDAEEFSTDQDFLSFTAKKDIILYVVTEKTDEHKRRKGKFYIDVSYLRRHKNRGIEILTFEIQAGEHFVMQELVAERFAPIFIIKEWE